MRKLVGLTFVIAVTGSALLAPADSAHAEPVVESARVEVAMPLYGREPRFADRYGAPEARPFGRRNWNSRRFDDSRSSWQRRQGSRVRPYWQDREYARRRGSPHAYGWWPLQAPRYAVPRYGAYDRGYDRGGARFDTRATAPRYRDLWGRRW